MVVHNLIRFTMEIILITELNWFFFLHRLRNRSKESFLSRGVKLSFMPMFIKAASMALLHFPILNSSVDQECENITFKVTSQRKNAFCHNIFLLLGYSVGSIYYLQHM